jgi:PAS domain S-box-containing protein
VVLIEKVIIFMEKPLQILHLEESASDSELLRIELEEAMTNIVLTQVDNKTDFIQKLESCRYDVVLSDFNTPNFNGLEIYYLVRDYYIDIPFIFVSRDISIEIVTDILHVGVANCILKEKLVKLPFVIERAFSECNEQKKRFLDENQLRESELFKDSILNSVGASIIVINTGGIIKNANQPWHRFEVANNVQARDDQSIYTIYQSLNVKQDIIENLKSAVLNIKKGDLDYYYFDYHIVNEQGSKWYTVRLNDFKNQPWVVLSQTNITLRKNAENLSKSNEEKFRLLFDNMSDGIVNIRENGIIEFFNESFAKILGYETSELHRRKFQEILHNTAAVREFNRRLKERKEGKAENYECQLKRKDGKRIWVSVKATPIFNELEEFTGTTSIVRDITSHSRWEIERQIQFDIIKKSNEQGISLKAILSFVQKELNKYLDAENFYVALSQTDEKIEFIHFEDSKNDQKNLPSVRINGNGLSEYIIRTNQPLLLNEDTELFQRKENLDICGISAKSWVGAPILFQDKPIGVIACQSYDNENEFDEFHLRFLMVIANQLGLIIQRINTETEKSKIFELSRDLICVVQKNTTFSYVNPAFTRVLGYASEELLKTPLFSIAVDEDLGNQLSLLFSDLEKGKAIDDNVVRLKHKDGSFRYVAWSGTPDENGENFFCIGRDITDQKIIQDRIESSEKRFRQIYNSMNEGLLYLDLEGKIKAVNPGFCSMIGYSEIELIGKSSNELIKDGNFPIEMEPNTTKMKSGFQTINEVKFSTKSGGEISTQVSASPYFSDDGVFSGMMSVIADLTERKKQEQERFKLQEEFSRELEYKVVERTMELDDARRELVKSLEKEKELGELKSRFVATASHQFRTPLSVIQSNMGILSMQKDGMKETFIPKFEKSYNNIKVQIERMTDLMNEVLILGKINAGNINAKIEPVDILTLCMAVVKNYSEIDNGNVINLDLKGTPYLVDIDPALFENAFSNILSNAIKYSPDAEQIYFALLYSEEYIELTVRDYGIGIPEDSIKYIFQPFYRAANVYQINGTGLGMSIAKEYIELIGGTIEVKSEVNKGTEFIIKLKR